VLGPLVICLATVEKDREQELRKIGVKDSKLLTPKKRESLYGKIVSICNEFVVMKTTANSLNDEMKKHSLNEIEAMELGKALSLLKIPPEAVYIDSPDTVAKRFCTRIRKYHSGDEELICEHKADFNYPICSAASIIAKVERDAVIEEIKKELGCNFGSGYTSDDRTIDFLKKNFHRLEIHKYIRKEWETIDKLKQRKLSEFDADE
jgi:ribonuclease HII